MTRFSLSILSAFTAIALFSACSTSKPVPVASPQAIAPAASPSPIASAQPKQSPQSKRSPQAKSQAKSQPQPKRLPFSDVGKTDQTGTVIRLDIPPHAECHRSYQSVKRDSFENCLVLGMTYVQVANVFGNVGRLQAESGNAQIWQWRGAEGEYATASFIDGYMVSRSQIGLEN